MNKSSFKQEYTHKLAIAVAFLIIFLGILHAFFSPFGQKSESTSAVLCENSQIFFDDDLKIPITELAQNDLVKILFSGSEDVVYVRAAALDIPAIEGYLPKDKLSFDFDDANQAVVLTDNVYSEPIDTIPLQNTNAKGSVCSVDEWYGEWRKISLPGGAEAVWIKESDLSYELTFDQAEKSAGEYYSQIKEYLQTEYTNTYKPYYDATVVNKLVNYKEDVGKKTITAEFIMKAQHRNYYKDPDTVEYIRDAKKMAEENDNAYYQKLYTTYYNEYNQLKESNYHLKFTSDINRGKIIKDTVRLYNNTDTNAGESIWQELENGFGDYIIE